MLNYCRDHRHGRRVSSAEKHLNTFRLIRFTSNFLVANNAQASGLKQKPSHSTDHSGLKGDSGQITNERIIEKEKSKWATKILLIKQLR